MDLSALNRQFYLKIQKYFNISRQSPWDGWQKLLSYLPNLQGPTLQVLDLGCGNGRFGIWLKKQRRIDYTGLDNNRYLLAAAAKALPRARLLQHDLTKPWGLKDKFDLVTILGVLHHLAPAIAQQALKRASARLKPGGVLFLNFWEFDPKKGKYLGNNDYLMPWRLGVTAERYCHLYASAEIKKLLTPLKLKTLADFRADKSNRYLVLAKR